MGRWSSWRSDHRPIPADFERIYPEEGFKKLSVAIKALSEPFLVLFKEFSVEKMAIFGVMKDFFDTNEKQKEVQEHNGSPQALMAMKDYIQLSRREADRIHEKYLKKPYSKDFYRSLDTLEHPIHEYFSSASILPCSIVGNKISVLMTDVYKYNCWIDSRDPNSPFNCPNDKGERVLRFLGGKRKNVPERPYQTALREFQEECGGAVPKCITEELEPKDDQKVIWLGNARMVVFKVEVESNCELDDLIENFHRDLRFDSSINHVGLEWVTFTVNEYFTLMTSQTVRGRGAPRCALQFETTDSERRIEGWVLCALHKMVENGVFRATSPPLSAASDELGGAGGAGRISRKAVVVQSEMDDAAPTRDEKVPPENKSTSAVTMFLTPRVGGESGESKGTGEGGGGGGGGGESGEAGVETERNEGGRRAFFMSSWFPPHSLARGELADI
uniref:Nudix hydrolase domain-containing protein n=1 Tax=Cryptomonas curvata TaxID=233186 RepID=A0A7S0MX10_9CRYP|mmetsp:Transcript_55475/g.116073  ORF Transcript_55475/g.116073 Transcript_55475/m.116073 type:complete len:445 (+) Transcript_55475:162-1496(+)